MCHRKRLGNRMRLGAAETKIERMMLGQEIGAMVITSDN